jgi:hypothetical protein
MLESAGERPAAATLSGDAGVQLYVQTEHTYVFLSKVFSSCTILPVISWCQLTAS